MGRKALLLCAALLFVFLCDRRTASGEDALLTIVDVAWTHGVRENRQPFDRLEQASANQPLTLWMQVRCTPAALELLRNQGQLPILHEWTYSDYVEFPPDTLRMTDSISLSAGRADILDQLSAEVRGVGWFNWRTWSTKRNLWDGFWRVRVTYADGSPVRCGGQNCEYWIELGE